MGIKGGRIKTAEKQKFNPVFHLRVIGREQSDQMSL
jgi:hypothetical protein